MSVLLVHRITWDSGWRLFCDHGQGDSWTRQTDAVGNVRSNIFSIILSLTLDQIFLFNLLNQLLVTISLRWLLCKVLLLICNANLIYSCIITYLCLVSPVATMKWQRTSVGSNKSEARNLRTPSFTWEKKTIIKYNQIVSLRQTLLKK